MRASHNLHRVVPVQIVTKDCKQRELTKLFDSEAVLAVTVERYSCAALRGAVLYCGVRRNNCQGVYPFMSWGCFGVHFLFGAFWDRFEVVLVP